VSSKKVSSDRVVIAVDPHKASWTAAAVGSGLQPLATIRVPVSREGYQGLRQFAKRWPDATWAVEGAGGLGAPLVTQLCADGIAALDVPAKLATRVRMLSTGHGRKNDDADAVSVGVAALAAAGLRSVVIDEAITALRALVEHRDDMVKTRTQTVNRLHVLLTQLLPAGASRNLSADHAAQLLRSVRPRSIGPRTLRRLAVELIGEVRHIDRRIATTTSEISAAVTACASTLTELRGIGDLSAGKILARVGDITRFRSPAAFASYTGTVPPRSRCPPEPGTASSTPACTSWPSPKSNATPLGGTTTSANAPPARGTKKRCDASKGGFRTWSTASSCATPEAGRQRAREDTRGRL